MSFWGALFVWLDKKPSFGVGVRPSPFRASQRTLPRLRLARPPAPRKACHLILDSPLQKENRFNLVASQEGSNPLGLLRTRAKLKGLATSAQIARRPANCAPATTQRASDFKGFVARGSLFILRATSCKLWNTLCERSPGRECQGEIFYGSYHLHSIS